MNKSLLLIACVAFITSLMSCKKSNSDPSPSSGGSSPVNVTFLKVGATSTYAEDNGFYNDTIYTVVDSEVAKDTFLIRNYSSMSTVGPSQYLVLSNDVLSYSYRLRDKNSYMILCKFNQPVGTTWTANRYGTLAYTATIDALNVTIATGKGNLTDVVKVKLVTPSNSTSYQYYSPTAGVLGAGDGTTTLYLKDYTTSTAVSTAPSQAPAITFGNFPFLSVGNYWNYYFDLGYTTDSLRLDVLSVDSRNVYKVKITLKSSGATTNEYWFEDNGYLKAYVDGETVLQGDPIYLNPSSALLNYGWVGTSNTTMFVYRITSLNAIATSAKYGTQTCMEISVTSSTGLIPQYNYWHADKGEVHVSSLSFTQDLDKSNIRTSKQPSPFIPGIHI